MTDKCSCGARDKAKCSKENGLGCGKMCLKDYEPIPESLIERINVIKEKAKMNQSIEDNIQSVCTDEQRLLTDPEYSKQWVEEEVRKSGQWFLEEIYK